jgi:hypothetical protein
VDDGSDRLYSDVESPRNPREAHPTTVAGRILIKEIYGEGPSRLEYPDSSVAASEELQHNVAERIILQQQTNNMLEECNSLLADSQWLQDGQSDDGDER